MRLQWLLLGLMVAAGAAPAACGGETDTTYGPPDGIVGRQAPQPTSTATSTSTGTATATGTGTTPPAGDSGTPSPSGDSGTTPPAEGGGTGACSVSWSTQVFPMLDSTGSGACATAACHGTQTPTMLTGNANGTYNSLKGYTLLNNVPYINPASTDPAQSAMDCNLVTGSCGALAMPEAPGALSAAQKTTIDTWIKCGAPNN